MTYTDANKSFAAKIDNHKPTISSPAAQPVDADEGPLDIDSSNATALDACVESVYVRDTDQPASSWDVDTGEFVMPPPPKPSSSGKLLAEELVRAVQSNKESIDQDAPLHWAG